MNVLKKWQEKEPVWFAVGWILVYVLVQSNADSLSETLGHPKLITVFAGLLLSLLLFRYVRQSGQAAGLGLCPPAAKGRMLLWFLPLVLMSTVNFWNGLSFEIPALEVVCYMVSMCFVGFLEEVIFRGLLFRGLSRENVKTAILVSSLTFGVGHIVNLLLGEPVFATLLQLVYASAIGFCYTAVFYCTGSILPCILSHAFINAISILARQPGMETELAIAAIQTLLSVGYGLYLLKNNPCRLAENNRSA